MFALRVEFITGRAVSQQFDDRMAPEWPPHPARLYFALASAYFERGEAASEREFLEWLERQSPPAVAATEAQRRDVRIHYVPVNDVRVSSRRGDRGAPPTLDELAVLPEWRRRQARTFPSVVPRDPVVHYVWPDAHLPEELSGAAHGLISRVTYLGHSSSLVSVCTADDPPAPSYEPVDPSQLRGEEVTVLRVPFDGQLEALQRHHRRYVATGIRGALPAVSQAYRRVAGMEPSEPGPVRPVFGDMVVFRRLAGPVLPMLGFYSATDALRGAALAHCPEPIPEVLSGHRPDGRPSEQPHVAFVPLPDVGHRHADGHIMGLAAVLPTSLEDVERRLVLQALARIEHLTLGEAGSWSVTRVTTDAWQRAIQPETWRGPATRWASVTPVLLDRYPKDLLTAETESIVADACERIGLPRPSYVLASSHAILAGVPPTHAFRRVRKPPRPMVHVVLDFPVPVAGPMLLGAGRYRGWGLCRPLR